MTPDQIATAIEQTEKIAAVFAARARQALKDNDPDARIENILKFEECNRWISDFRNEHLKA